MQISFKKGHCKYCPAFYFFFYLFVSIWIPLRVFKNRPTILCLHTNGSGVQSDHVVSIRTSDNWKCQYLVKTTSTTVYLSVSKQVYTGCTTYDRAFSCCKISLWSVCSYSGRFPLMLGPNALQLNGMSRFSPQSSTLTHFFFTSRKKCKKFSLWAIKTVVYKWKDVFNSSNVLALESFLIHWNILKLLCTLDDIACSVGIWH